MITSRQAQIYRIWATLNSLDLEPITSRHRLCKHKVGETAKQLGQTKENVRQTVAKVLRCLEQGESLPPAETHCFRCYGVNIQQIQNTKAGNQQFYCAFCRKNFVWFTVK